MGGGSDNEEEIERKREFLRLAGLPEDLTEECKQEDEGVYPDNWQSVNLFLDMMTQWRVGMGGVIGLDYNALPVIWNARRIKTAERGDLLDDLKMMERAALAHLQERRDV
jgi:hypothetical protein